MPLSSRPKANSLETLLRHFPCKHSVFVYLFQEYTRTPYERSPVTKHRGRPDVLGWKPRYIGRSGRKDDD